MSVVKIVYDANEHVKSVEVVDIPKGVSKLHVGPMDEDSLPILATLVDGDGEVFWELAFDTIHSVEHIPENARNAAPGRVIFKEGLIPENYIEHKAEVPVMVEQLVKVLKMYIPGEDDDV